METEIRVSTDRSFWRRKLARRSDRDQTRDFPITSLLLSYPRKATNKQKNNNKKQQQKTNKKHTTTTTTTTKNGKFINSSKIAPSTPTDVVIYRDYFPHRIFLVNRGSHIREIHRSENHKYKSRQNEIHHDAHNVCGTV